MYVDKITHLFIKIKILMMTLFYRKKEILKTLLITRNKVKDQDHFIAKILV